MAERERRRRNATATFATRMAEVYDQVDGLAHASRGRPADLSESCKALQEGIAMTRDIYRGTLEKFGVEPLVVEPGAELNATRLESVGEVAAAGVANGAVARVVRPGWILGAGRPDAVVLRRAQVEVAGRAA